VSARKRMSLRAIARMKRENRELRERLSSATRRDEYHTLSTWTDFGQRKCDEVKTATKLGYTVEVYITGDSATFTAVKRVSA
jgi:hypothetical protein